MATFILFHCVLGYPSGTCGAPVSFFAAEKIYGLFTMMLIIFL